MQLCGSCAIIWLLCFKIKYNLFKNDKSSVPGSPHLTHFSHNFAIIVNGHSIFHVAQQILRVILHASFHNLRQIHYQILSDLFSKLSSICLLFLSLIPSVSLIFFLKHLKCSPDICIWFLWSILNRIATIFTSDHKSVVCVVQISWWKNY